MLNWPIWTENGSKSNYCKKNRFLGLFLGAFYGITVTIGDIGRCGSIGQLKCVLKFKNIRDGNIY